MATFTGVLNAQNIADTSTGGLAGFTGGTVAELQDGIGDTFIGGNLGDSITGGAGRDSINAGAGDDIIRLSGAASEDNIDGGSGTDLLDLSGYTALANPGLVGTNIDLDGNAWRFNPGSAANIAGIETIFATQLNDFIQGGSAVETFLGNGGDDSLAGFLGNDVLSGGAGNDFLIGDIFSVSAFDGPGVLNRAANTNNNSVATAIDISDVNNAGTLYNNFANANIAGAPFVRHLSVLSPSDATDIVEFYKINLAAGQTVFFDIDNATNLDSVLRLSGANGSVVVGLNDTSDITLGAGGSATTADSFLVYTAPTAGFYTLEVGNKTQAGNVLDRDLVPSGIGGVVSYTLNVALSQLSGDGNDNLAGGDGTDTLMGGDGDDTLSGSLGTDVLLGGNGNDRFAFQSNLADNSEDIIDGGTGIDQLRIVGSFGLNFSTYSSGAPMRSIEQVFFEGNSSATFDSRQFGGDRLSTNMEFLSNGGGISNSVTISVVQSSTTLAFSAAGFTFTNWDAVDRVVIRNDNPGNGPSTLTGSSVTDVIFGRGGADVLTGGAGNDTLTGDGGVDLLSGGDGDDWLEGELGNSINPLALPAGNDTINGENGADTVLGGGGDDNITGGAGQDVLVGETGNDTIAGGSEFDAVDGRQGNDVLSGDDGADIIFGDGFYLSFGFGNDTLSGGAGDDIMMGEAGEPGANGGNDQINGDAGNDLLDGGGGIDVIFGGAGGDIIDGDNGNDYIVGGTGTEIMLGSNAVAFGGPTTGQDLFVYQAMTDQGDSIYGFDLRAGDNDGIDLRPLFDALGYAGTTPRQDGYLYVFQNVLNADIYIDADGAANGINLDTRMLTLVGVTATEVTDSFFLFQ